MINRICDVCGAVVNDNWVLRIYDNDTSFEVNGCKKCIDDLDLKVKSIKDSHKKSVDKVLNEINFIKENDKNE